MSMTRRSRTWGRTAIDSQVIWLLLAALTAFETYILLPPGIPFLPKLGLVPMRYRLTNYAVVGLVAYGLTGFGFTVVESLALGSIWMTLTAYMVFDYLYDVPLLTV